ncbi:MAG TPA: hypothetical protein ENK47_05480 [Euryarchaeota archaeon]|nr:MAG: hypothetical protein B6U90_05170 [Thermoplasmatales archaeon ex4484_6]RLF69396.1 MAG: hypothetical protein DRN57_00815 [Thermoplasmata archaeon]HHD16142.1 hypothetical protein [Euryarchaeota archaeon]
MLVESIGEMDRKLLKNGSQVIIKASGERYITGLSDLINRLVREEGDAGLLISTRWSSNALHRRIGFSKLPKGSLKVIDTISLSLGSRPASDPYFIFIPTPAPLESILIAVERSLKKGSKEMGFLMIDSLTYLKDHYTEGQLNEFFHYILNRMLENDISTFIFDQETGDGTAVSRRLASLMDNTVEIGGGGEE